ncbi:uncharacterized protein LOC128879947 [Hylaeus volcanicus]|uniref:uncharacterized protein LOC128879947 n=1 Tax=Hylaeus volcanicus TaxID=313075 RepID=UPI0023B775AE|nr:uncharacterized protein LOC128879947 [Hylaeus volcanicus]
MVYLSIHSSLCAVVLTTFSTSSGTGTTYNEFYSSAETKYLHQAPLSSQESQNLNLLLAFLLDSPEFRPLTLSIILPEFRSNAADVLLRYSAENPILVYKVRARDLSLEATWMERSHLTWAFFVKDVFSLNIFIYWQPKLWQSSNQYLIFFNGRTTTVAWRDIFRNLWNKYSVYRAVIVSTEDNFDCLVRYAPFEVHDNEFGGVHKLCLTNNVTVPKFFEYCDDSSSRHLAESKNAEVEFLNETKQSSPETYDDDASRYSAELNNVDKVLLLNETTRLFEIFHDMNNYPLEVVVFKSLLMGIAYDDKTGLRLRKVDAEVLYSLEGATKSKFHVKVMRIAEFRRIVDPFDLSLRDIESGRAEMVITGFFVKAYPLHPNFRFTAAVYEDKLCFLAPDSGLVPKAYMPFLPFEKNLWALLAIYNVGITLLWCFTKYLNLAFKRRSIQPTRALSSSDTGTRPLEQLECKGSWTNQLRKRSKRSKGRFNPPTEPLQPPQVPRYVSLFFDFVELFCYPLQNGDSPAQRALLIGTLFFGLIVNGVYQSSLVSSLSKPFHYPQLNTLEDVVDSGKILFTKYANLKNVFQDDMAVDRALLRKIRVVNETKSTKYMVAYENMIAITRYFSMVLGNYAFHDKDGNPLLHVVDECPMNYRVSYVLRSQSPYMERVNFVLLRLKEAGLFSVWFENITYPLTIVKMRSLRRDDTAIKLTLDHYSLTFLLLFVGLLVSTFIFLGEVYVTRRKR